MKHISDELLVNYLVDECNEQEQTAVENWLAENPENQLYFHQFERIWIESKALGNIPLVDTEASWQRMKARMQHKRRWAVQKTMYWAAAAILLVVGLFSMYTFWQRGIPSKPADSLVAIPSIIESKSETLVDTLSDKSIVTLNKNASLQYPKQFSEKERRVKLRGEAFFNISPNARQPFYIEASNDVEIRVVGTSFNVKSFDAYTEVIVETGIVEVRKFNRVLLLHPREKARIDKEDSTIVVQRNSDKLYKYYRSKEFECDNTPLWKVVEVLNEAYGDSIVIGRTDLKSLTLTTRFDNESLESILEVISETFEIKVEKKGNKYILK
ncbi:MAG: FecR domain-containing protein [Bacteroidetes bacterium]|nr:FecR domain-containing protein [Bacteroidota bacterium]